MNFETHIQNMVIIIFYRVLVHGTLCRSWLLIFIQFHALSSLLLTWSTTLCKTVFDGRGINLQDSAVKCIADSMANSTGAASWNCLPSLMVTALPQILTDTRVYSRLLLIVDDGLTSDIHPTKLAIISTEDVLTTWVFSLHFFFFCNANIDCQMPFSLEAEVLHVGFCSLH